MATNDHRSAEKAGKRLALLRSARAEMKAKIKTNELDWHAIMLGNAGDDLERVIKTMRVLTFLRAVPGIGELTAYDAMEHFKIVPPMRFTGMTMELRKDLADLVQRMVS